MQSISCSTITGGGAAWLAAKNILLHRCTQGNSQCLSDPAPTHYIRLPRADCCIKLHAELTVYTIQSVAETSDCMIAAVMLWVQLLHA